MDLRHIQRTFYPIAPEYTFFSSTYGPFSRINYVLDQKTSLSTFSKSEIKPSIFSDHNGMKRDIKNKRKTRKFTNK